MKYLIHVLIAVCCPILAFCQDITGLWKGTMYNDSTNQSFDYEIVISKVKGKLTGFSLTSYVINDKKYYGIKKINVRIAKDGKIVLQDAKMIENNYPDKQNKNVIQLDVLSLANNGTETFLDGLFVTNRSREFNEATGRMSIKKANPLLAQSDLMKYLENNTADGNLTVVK
jgi:inorganic pyrophosphatase/exopolyphosphatase